MVKTDIKAWISAFRLRTLPLALSCIGMGSFLAYYHGVFNLPVFVLAILTTLFLQILSNLANDYGDSVHGADNAGRTGPVRSVQSGAISKAAMKKSILYFAVISLVSGTALLLVAFHGDYRLFLVFLAIGLAAIAAAVAYTNGKKPYGYVGLGDLFVFLFFGPVAVGGVYFLFSTTLDWHIMLPAVSCGAFSVAVLNVNNIRDIESDRKAGKRSIPVRLGREMAVMYHIVLIAGGWAAATMFAIEQEGGWSKFLFVASLPLFMRNIAAVKTMEDAEALDPYLKQLAIGTLVFVMLFGTGLLLN